MGAAPRSRTLARPIPLGWADDQATQRPGEGTPAAYGPGEGAPAARPPSGPTKPGPWHRLRALEMLGLVLVVIAAMVHLLDVPGPEDAAREYLDAVVAGDSATIRAHLAPSLEAADLALRDEILRGTPGRITSYRIEETRIREGRAELSVRLRSSQGIATITLTARSDSPGPFSAVTWRLDPVRLPELSVVAPAGAEGLLVNGALVDLDRMPGARPGGGSRTLSFSLLPGTYEIALPPQGDLVRPGDVRRSVPLRLGQWRSAHTIVLYELTRAGERAARETIRSALGECAEDPSPQPRGCPFGIDPAQAPWSRADGTTVDLARPAAGGGAEQMIRGGRGVEADGRAPGADPGPPVAAGALRGQWTITTMPVLTAEHTTTHGWIFRGSGGRAQYTTSLPDPDTGQMVEASRTVPLDLHAVVRSRLEGGFAVRMISQACGLRLVADAETGALLDPHTGSCP